MSALRTIQRALPREVRSAGRKAAVELLRPARVAHILPTGLVSLDDLLASESVWGVPTAISVSEHRYPDPVPPWSPVARPPRPVRTIFAMLEAAGADGWRFDLNHVVAPDDRIVYEPNQRFVDLPASLQRLSRTPKPIDGLVAYLANTWPDNYSHWMLLTLPLVERYRDHLGSDPDHWYVGRKPNRWQIESLARAGITEDRLVWEPIRPERLIVCAVGRYGRGVDPRSLSYVRRLFDVDVDRPRTRRIFLARGEATTRRFVNEAECFDAVSDLDFEFIETKGLSLSDEATLFSDSDFVITCHGSAGTNLAFAPNGSTLLELFPPELHSDSNMVFVELMSLLEGRHLALMGRPTRSRRKPIDIDVDVDPAALRSLVERALTADCDGQRRP